MVFTQSLVTAGTWGWWLVLVWLVIEVLRFGAFTPLKSTFPDALKRILAGWPGAGGADNLKHLLDELLTIQKNMKSQFAEVNKGVQKVQIALANVDDIVGNILKNTEALLNTLTQWAAHFDSMSAALLDIDRDVRATKIVSEENKTQLATIAQSAADLNNGLQRIEAEMSTRFTGLETELATFGNEIKTIKSDISSINGGVISTATKLSNIEDNIQDLPAAVDQKTRQALDEHTIIVSDLINKINVDLDPLLAAVTAAKDEFKVSVEKGKDEIKKILEDDIIDKNGKLAALTKKLTAIQAAIPKAVKKKGEKASAAVKEVNNQRQDIKFSINDLIEVISKYDDTIQGVRNHAGISYQDLTRQATMIPNLRDLALKLNEEMMTLENLFDAASKQKGEEDDEVDRIAKELWQDEKFNLQEQDKLAKLNKAVDKIEEGFTKVEAASSDDEKKKAEAFLLGWRNAANKLVKQLKRMEYRDDRRTNLDKIIKELVALNDPVISGTLKNVGQQIQSFNSKKMVELSDGLQNSLSNKKLKTVKSIRKRVETLMEQITALNRVESELREMLQKRKNH